MKKQTKSNNWKLQLVLAFGMLLAGTAARAEMITVGGDQTAGTGTLTINQDITFTINTSYGGNPENEGGDSIYFVFDEIVQNDNSQDYASFSGLTYSINGAGSYAIDSWIDNFAATVGDITANDGFIYYNNSDPLYLSPNDTITLHAGTGTMDGTAVPSFNPWSSGNYNMFIAGYDGARISDVVPEPSVFALSGLVGIGVLAIRRIFMI